MRKFAFLIGINEYQMITPLSTPNNDVNAIGGLLKNQFSYKVDYCAGKKGEAVTFTQLLNYFSFCIPEILSDEPEEVQVLIYFAGHGIAENSDAGIKGYLVPTDGKRGENSSWYPMEELLSSLEALNVKHLLLVLDCCFGGAIRWASKYRNAGFISEEKISLQHYKYFTEQHSWQVMTSTAPDQSALDFFSHGKVKNHSPFANLFLNGLTSRAKINKGIITTAELFGYLQQRLPLVTGAKGNPQNVGLFPMDKHNNGEFLFLSKNFKTKQLTSSQLKNPYKGLAPYDSSDSQVFFGREKAIEELTEKINSQSLTVVIGASGTGKSSLIKAGVIPKLSGKIEDIKPGRKPMLELNSLGDFDGLVIDQFEQLITQSEEDQIPIFWNKLSAYINNGKKLIITIRIDFEKQLDIPDELSELWNKGRYIIPPFSAEELRAAIITPALRVGRFIEPLSLVDEIIDEVIHYPGSLPLLSFTMQQLFEKCSDNLFRNITPKDYRELGGVIGALQSSADKVYDTFNDKEKETMRHLMLRMVSLTGGETAGKRVMSSELVFDDSQENDRIQKVIQKLQKEGLIMGGQDKEKNNYIEPSHDALVRTWKKMQEWIKTFSEDKILLHARLEHAVDEYKKKGAKRKHLWYNSPNRSQVIDAQKTADKQTIPLVLNRQESEFIKKSKQLFTTIISSVATVILLVIIGLSWLTLVAYQQTEIAKEQTGIAIKQTEIAKDEKEEAVANLLKFQKADRLRLNQRLKPLLTEAEIFQDAEEFDMAKARYDSIDFNMKQIKSLTEEIGDTTNFKTAIKQDTTKILRKNIKSVQK